MNKLFYNLAPLVKSGYNPIFFILGRERSGTTLLQNVLNLHSDIFIPYEAPFIAHLLKKYGETPLINNLDHFIEDLLQEPYLISWNLNKAILKERLNKISEPTFQNYCREILAYHNGKNARLLGDKNPVNALFCRSIESVFNDSKFIWIIRDYRAQVNSMMKVNFEKKNITSLSYRWLQYNQEINSLIKSRPTKVLMVKYEDLVNQPKETIEKICHFLNLPFQTEMLSNSFDRSAYDQDHHLSLNENLNTKHIFEWKQELSDSQIKTCEQICSAFGKTFGYETTPSDKHISLKKDFIGTVYGRMYMHFLRFLYRLPLKLKYFINRKLIYPNSSYWKSQKRKYEETN